MHLLILASCECDCIYTTTHCTLTPAERIVKHVFDFLGPDKWLPVNKMHGSLWCVCVCAFANVFWFYICPSIACWVIHNDMVVHICMANVTVFQHNLFFLFWLKSISLSLSNCARLLTQSTYIRAFSYSVVVNTLAHISHVVTSSSHLHSCVLFCLP